MCKIKIPTGERPSSKKFTVVMIHIYHYDEFGIIIPNEFEILYAVMNISSKQILITFSTLKEASDKCDVANDEDIPD